MGIIEVLALAFVGGMLLNLMPCVLPVLAVKTTALASMGDSSLKRRFHHAAGYTAGILASMLALAVVVIGLQQAGQTVGWGFQFQQPLFVAFLAAVMVLFALNLFGVYEIGIPNVAANIGGQHSAENSRSFFEGILAVVLATPCTAPFMGTAVGFAMTSSPAVIAVTFVSLGAGLAAPFVAIALFPKVQGLLPSPGPWMGVMKSFLGFALLGTALWLTWLFGRLVGLEAVTGLLGFLIALSLAAWLYGQVQYRQFDRLKSAAFLVALLAVGVGGWLGLGNIDIENAEDRFAVDGPAAGAHGEQAPTEIDWIEWTPTIVEEKLDEGRPVFVNFTADWCLTCKATEREVISTPEVIEAAWNKDVAMVMADLTHTDDRLVEELESFGRSGVPLYLVYGPDNPDEPEVLPEVLSKSRLIDEFADAQ